MTAADVGDVVGVADELQLSQNRALSHSAVDCNGRNKCIFVERRLNFVRQIRIEPREGCTQLLSDNRPVASQTYFSVEFTVHKKQDIIVTSRTVNEIT
jgi:hypothetical protein